MRDIGKELKKYIRRTDYNTEKDFAEKMNISPSTLSKYLLNQRQIPTDTLASFAKELDFSIDHILGVRNKQDEMIIGALTKREETIIKLLRNLPQEQYDQTVEAILILLKNSSHNSNS